MIDSKTIYKKANNLVQLYGTRNTLVLAESTGIDVVYADKFKSLLGMYIYRWKHRAMFLNDRMEEYLTLMVAGHELGHDVLHRDEAKAITFSHLDGQHAIYCRMDIDKLSILHLLIY